MTEGYNSRDKSSDMDKEAATVAFAQESNDLSLHAGKALDEEVFGAGGEGNVNFRTVGWIKASFFFLKMTFAIGVLSIPSSLYTMGLGAGLVSLIGWGALNTYCALLLGVYKQAHPGVHSISDATKVMALQTGRSERTAVIIREIFEGIYIFTCILAAGVSMLGLGIAFNAVSKHATCTVVFNVVSFVLITGVGSIRKIGHLAWITWAGFISVVIAVMMVVIAVALRDRPAAAPATGDFDLGFSWLPATGVGFVGGFSASLAVYASSGNICAYVPVLSEMKNPRDYWKSVATCMTWINASYLSFTITMFYYCGKWVATPALGSAGPTIKIIAYSIAIPGLIAGAMVWVHVAGKTLFVRALRDSRHLTANTFTHWAVWLSCCFSVGTIAFIFAEVIPFFNYFISLIGSLCYGPLSLFVPALMWISLNPTSYKESLLRRVAFYFHVFLAVLGVFVTVAGTYATIVGIVDAYKIGAVGGIFSCEDNSGTVAGG